MNLFRCDGRRVRRPCGVYGHRRCAQGLTTESASRPHFGREVWKNSVLWSPTPPPGTSALRRRGREPFPPNGLSTGVERPCGIGMGSIVHDAPALEVWSAVLTTARSELPDTTIVMWFSDVQPVRLIDEVLTLSVPSALVRERLQHHH